MTCSCSDVATMAGLTVGYLVAGCVAPAVGVVGLLGAIPRYFYKRHQLNQLRKKSAALIDQLANQVLGDKTRVVNDKNYMDPKSRFTTRAELDALKKCQSDAKNNDKIAFKIKKVQKFVTKKNNEVDDASIWIASFALCLFAHLGLGCAISLLCQQGEANACEDLEEIKIHQSKTSLALAYHVAVTQRIVDRQDTVVGVTKVLRKVPQTAGHSLDLVQERILSYLIDKDAFSKKTKTKAPAVDAAGSAMELLK